MGTGVTVGNENTNMDILTESGNVTCATESKLLNQTKDTATYEIKATGENVEAVFTVSLKVTEKILELSVDKVDVKSGVVRTFGFLICRWQQWQEQLREL